MPRLVAQRKPCLCALPHTCTHAQLPLHSPRRGNAESAPAPTTLSADNTGLEFFAVRYDWSAFTSVEETRSYIVFIDRFGNTPAMIPRATLANHLPAFLDFAREQMTKAPPRA